MSLDQQAPLRDLEAEAIALAEREPGRAGDMFKDILAREPNRLTVLRPLARLLMKQARFEEARVYWERITVLAPKDGEPRMALGRVHARAGRTPEALDRLDEVLRINPANEDARRLRAKIAAKEIADLSASIGVANIGEMASRIEVLDRRLAGDANFERLKTYHALLRARDAEDESGALAFEDSTESESLEFLSQLNAIGDAPSTDELEEIERKSGRIAAANPMLAKSLAQFHFRRGDAESAFNVYRRLSVENDIAQLWLEAAGFAASWNRHEVLVEFCTRAVRAPDADRAVGAEAVAMLCEAGAHDAAVALLRGMPDHDGDADARRRVVRVLFESGRDREVIAEALDALGRHVPSAMLGEDQLGPIVEIVRRLRRAAWRTRIADGIASRRAALGTGSDNSAIMNWTLGMLAGAELDVPAATAYFEAAQAQDLPKNLRIDPAAEIALLHERFYRYGEAYEAMRALPDPATLLGEYTALQRVRSVVEFCGADRGLLFPECLIDVIFEEIARNGGIGYAPRRGHLLTVSSSLRAGGSERQTVTVAGKMAAEPCLKKVVLALRQMDDADTSSFLRAARETRAEIVHFGADWSRHSNILAELPALEGRERLVRAIDLLPHLHREELIRVTKLILERRPQAVHLRQDLFIAGVACRLAGVGRFLIHRGSLSPDLWGHGPLETSLFLRPMRHAYRRLLEHPGFSIVNNSRAGADSDRDWTGWPDAAPFRVIYNAVEFARLDRGQQADLRAQAGIPREAFLIGGIFRIEPVKRPMLWIEAASLVAAECPNAHFVVLGDGRLAEEMRGFACEHGFAERLHMPGFVSNVADWLRVIDLNLLTSDREGLPNVLIEGQHFGVPAVSSDVGGAFETIEPGVTGHLVPAEAGAAAFAYAILKIIADEEWRRTARARAPAFAHTKFGVEGTICELFASLGIER